MALLEPIKEKNVRIGYEVYCPGCERKHTIFTRRVGKHGLLWIFNGSQTTPSFEPSLFFYYPHSICHSRIINGNWHYFDDSTHRYSGRVVPMVRHDLGELR